MAFPCLRALPGRGTAVPATLDAVRRPTLSRRKSWARLVLRGHRVAGTTRSRPACSSRGHERRGQTVPWQLHERPGRPSAPSTMPASHRTTESGSATGGSRQRPAHSCARPPTCSAARGCPAVARPRSRGTPGHGCKHARAGSGRRARAPPGLPLSAHELRMARLVSQSVQGDPASGHQHASGAEPGTGGSRPWPMTGRPSVRKSQASTYACHRRHT